MLKFLRIHKPSQTTKGSVKATIVLKRRLREDCLTITKANSSSRGKKTGFKKITSVSEIPDNISAILFLFPHQRKRKYADMIRNEQLKLSVSTSESNRFE